MSEIGRKTIVILATWFGCGRSPVMPGTAGTLGAIPLVWLVAQAGPLPYLAFTLLFGILAVFVAQFYESGPAGGRHDLPEVVIDEVAGFLVTMAWVPLTWKGWLGGFVLFRALDMAKPFPISWIDRRGEGGAGVVADDLVAGLVANVVLQYAFGHGIVFLDGGGAGG